MHQILMEIYKERYGSKISRFKLTHLFIVLLYIASDAIYIVSLSSDYLFVCLLFVWSLTFGKEQGLVSKIHSHNSNTT